MHIRDQFRGWIGGGEEHARAGAEESAAAVADSRVVEGIAHQLRHPVSLIAGQRLPAPGQHGAHSERGIGKGAAGELAEGNRVAG